MRVCDEVVGPEKSGWIRRTRRTTAGQEDSIVSAANQSGGSGGLAERTATDRETTSLEDGNKTGGSSDEPRCPSSPGRAETVGGLWRAQVLCWVSHSSLTTCSDHPAPSLPKPNVPGCSPGRGSTAETESCVSLCTENGGCL